MKVSENSTTETAASSFSVSRIDAINVGET